jgi:hypothetical protein
VAYPVVIQILNRNAGDLFYAGHGPIGSCLEVTFRKGLGCSVGKPMDFMIFTQYVIYIYDIYIYKYDKYDSHGFNSEGNHEPHDSFRNGNVTLMGKHESFSIIRPMKALSIQRRSTVVSPIPQTPGFWMVQEKTIETSQQWHT